MHAIEMKTKKIYTSPIILRATVELEGGFCGSVNNTIDAAAHETGFDNRNHENSSDWEYGIEDTGWE